MKLNCLGEFDLINRFSKPFAKNLPPGVEGIGDDAAVIPWKDDQVLVVTTDMLIENSHFLKEAISPEDLGYKSLAVNLSDIAAMGAKPSYVFLSLGLTEDLSVKWIDGFFEGFKKLAQEFDVFLLGGDTTKSKHGIVVDVTALGFVDQKNIKLRSHARSGDLICVTGFLGDSGAGLKALLEKAEKDSHTEYLIKQHHRPRPYVTEGQWLGLQSGVHAMMDVSDGIVSDLKHIVKKSSCGAKIDLDKLPLSRDLIQMCEKRGWNAQDVVATSGEDYCLLFTIDPHKFSQTQEAFKEKFSHPLFVIGEITGNTGCIAYLDHGKPFQLEVPGWNHFGGLSNEQELSNGFNDCWF